MLGIRADNQEDIMVAMIVGIVLLAFTGFAALPAGLNWGSEIAAFLQGCVPVAAAFIGFISIFIGIADLKDKQEAKREEEASKTNT